MPTEGELLKIDVPPLEPRHTVEFATFAEAPGADEMKNGEPLIGASGKLFNRILYMVGVRRRYVYIDNFCQTKLPGNNTDYLWKVTPKGRFKTHPDWPTLVERFYSKLDNLGCKLVILLGSTALVGMFGPEYGSIDSYRGYHVEYNGKIIMPTFHPARCLPGRSPSYQYIIYADIMKGMRIAQEGRTAEPFEYYIPGRGWHTETL